nr:872_t:CDS:2 [Entrophospora candida]
MAHANQHDTTLQNWDFTCYKEQCSMWDSNIANSGNILTSIFNQSLKLSKSIERISTKSEDQPAEISCENELVNINAYAVPFWDSFCLIYIDDYK